MNTMLSKTILQTLIITMVMLICVSTRHINIALLVSRDRDVDTFALRNSLSWAQKHIASGKGIMMAINKVVVDSSDNFKEEFLIRNLSQSSFILEPYFIHPHICMISELLDIPLVSVFDTHDSSCKNVLRMNTVYSKHLHKVLDEFLSEQDVPSVELIVERSLGDVASEIISNVVQTDSIVYYSILRLLNMSNLMEVEEIVTELQLNFHKHILLISRSHSTWKFIKQVNSANGIGDIRWFIPQLTVSNIKALPKGSTIEGLTIPFNTNLISNVKSDLDKMKTKYDKTFPGYLTIDPMLHDAIVAIAKTIQQIPMPWYRTHNQEICSYRNRKVKSDLSTIMKERISFDGLTGRVAFTGDGYRNLTNVVAQSVDIDGHVQQIGQWSEECQLFRFGKKGFYKNKRSRHSCKKTYPNQPLTAKIRKRHLKIVTIEDSPFIFYNESYGEGNNRFRGFCKDLLEELSVNLQFTYDLYLVPGEPSYGSCEEVEETEPCVWNGVIGEITSKKADIGLGSITITAEREEYVDFSKPFMDFTMTLIMEKGKGEQFDIYAFLKPFEYSVWLSIMGVAFCVTVILFIIDRISPNGCKKLAEKNSSELIGNEFAFHNCVWFTTASLLQQGPDYTPKSSSARILSATFWFFTLIMVSTYTANLAAFFTSNQGSSGIKSLEDLAKQDKIKYGILGRGQTYSLFKNSDIPLYKQMFNFMRSVNSFAKSSRLGVERVRQGGYAYLSEDPIIYYQHQREPCNTEVVRNLLEAKSYGLVLQRQSEWTNLVNIMILNLRERGVIEKLRRKWWDEASQCDNNAQETKGQAISLKISSLAGIYIIMIVGAVLSGVLLIVETKFKSIASSGKCISRQYIFDKSHKMKNELAFIDHCEMDQLDASTQKIQNQMNNSQEYLNGKVKRFYNSNGSTTPKNYPRYDVPVQFRNAPESTL